MRHRSPLIDPANPSTHYLTKHGVSKRFPTAPDTPLRIANRARNWNKGAVSGNASQLAHYARLYNVTLISKAYLPKGMPVADIIDSLSSLIRDTIDQHVEKIKQKSLLDKQHRP